MLNSPPIKYLSSPLCNAVMAAMLVFSSGLLNAADGIITVNESAFNEFANAIGTIPFSGTKKFKVGPITVCNSAYTASLKDLEFDIKTTGVDVEGQVTAKWCGVNFGGSGTELDATGNVFYDPAIDSVRFTFNTATVALVFHLNFWVWSGNVTVATIDVTSMLNDIPPVPVGRTLISFQTGNATSHVLMDPYNVSLIKKNGYVELHSDVLLQ